MPVTLTGTTYQLEKFIKHTAPTGSYPILSVFSDPAYETYRDYVVTTTVSGSAQIDDRGRTNLLWLAGQPVGATFKNGQFVFPTDTILVVWHDDQSKIHAFPVSSTEYGPANCANCGAPIFIQK